MPISLSKKVKSLFSFSFKLFILTSFLISQSFLTEIFLYHNNYNNGNVKIVKADYSDPWYTISSGWLYREKITINHSMVGTNTCSSPLLNFPVLISLTNQDYLKTVTGKIKGTVVDNNLDILFVSPSDNTKKLDHEIESYDGVNGNLVAWVKVPSLSCYGNSADTSVYMYYGNNSPSNQQNKTGVWDDGGTGNLDGVGNHFKMVQHLGGNIANGVAGHLDSTQYANNGTPYNFNGIVTSTTNGIGQINGDDIFDGTNDYVNAGNKSSLNITNTLTVEVWIKPNLGAFQKIITKDTTWLYEKQPFNLGFNNTGSRIIFYTGDGTNELHASAPSDNTAGAWSHIVATYDGSAIKVYKDGVAGSPTARTGNLYTNSTNVNFGQWGSGGYLFSGSIDEVRISDVARSADWIKAEYNNESDTSVGTGKFILSLGSEETYSISSDATLSNLVISSGTLTPTFSSSTTSYTSSVANSVSSLNITSIATQGSSSTIKVNGTTVASGASTPVSLIVGSNSISVVVTAPNTTTTKTYNITVTRTSLPVLAEATPVPTPANNTTPSYTFSSTSTGTITYGGVGCSSSASSAAAGPNTITFNTLPSGTHSDCTIQVTDSLGNPSNILAVSSFTIDTTLPTISSASTALPSGNYSISTAIPITINFSKPVTSTGNVTVTLNTAPSRSCTFTLSNVTTGSCTYTTQTGDSASNLNVSVSGTIKDQVGNSLAVPVSNISLGANITIDTAAPTTTPTATAAGSAYTLGNWTNSSSVLVSLPCSDGTGSGCFATKYCLDTNNSCDPTSGSGIAYNGSAISVSTTGTSYIRYFSKDNANNSEAIKSGMIRIDTVSPTVSGVTDGSTYNTNQTITFSDSLTTPTATLNGSAFTSGSTVSNDGTYTLIVTDGASNSTTVHFTIDKIAPTITSVTTTQVSGTYGVGTAILVTVNFSKAVTSTGNVTVTLNTTPSRTCTFAISNAASGSCTYTVQAGDSVTNISASISGTIQDQVGNTMMNFTPASNLSASKTINIDAVGPSAFTLISPSGSASVSTKTPTFSWNASIDSGSGLSKYQLYMDGTLNVDNINNSITSTSPNAELSCGDHAWQIKATDNVGNTNDSDTLNFNINCGTGFILPVKPIVTNVSVSASSDGGLNINNLPNTITLSYSRL
jgi:hypothetical protein